MKICLSCQKRITDTTWACPSCGWSPQIIDGFYSFAPNKSGLSDGFEPQFHLKLIQLEENCFWFRRRNKLLQFTLERYFPGRASFFEIGCGTGYVLASFSQLCPNMRVVGGELYISGLKLASRRISQVELIQVDAGNIPYENEFDVAGAFDVLEHIDDDQKVLQELFKILKPGGGLILTVPQHQWLWSVTDEIGHHKRRYHRQELLMKVRNAGFHILWVTSFNTFLFPLMLALRWWERLHSYSTEKFYEIEFGLPFQIDNIFEKVLELEQQFLQKGFSFLWGGSLLCVAAKG